MQKLLEYFIRYKVAVTILLLFFIIFGTIGAFNMKSSFFPLTESKNIMIQLVYPGASPEEIEEGVVNKIEDNLKGVSGIEQYTSISSENRATITVEILQKYSTQQAFEDVKNAVDKISSFPSGLEPPVVYKFENVDHAITFGLTGPGVSLGVLKSMARDVEKDLRNLDDISKISISGFPDNEIEIAVNENTLRAYQLTFNDVSRSVQNYNIDLTGGKIKTADEEYLIRGRYKNYYADEIDHIIVKTTKNGETVRLKDIAKIHERWSDNPNRVSINGEPGVQIRIDATDSEDLLTIASEIKKYVKKYNANSKVVKAIIIRDSSKTLDERKDLLVTNGWQGALLVLLFLSLFLNPRLSFWVAAGLPISFLGMFLLANYFGATINVISLFGMIVVIGILVDDGIVISENIYNHYEKGKTPVRAAIDGTLEVVPSIISAVLTTIIAFSTFFFLEGRIGDFFSELSFVVIATLSVSLIEALLILPSHIAHSKALLPKKDLKSSNKIVLFFEKFREKSEQSLIFLRDKIYAPILKWSLTHKGIMLAIPWACLLITLGAMQGGVIKGAFFPPLESNNIQVSLKMPAGTREVTTEANIEKIVDAAYSVNDKYKSERSDQKDIIKFIVKKIGPQTSDASLSIELLEGEERNIPSAEITDALRNAVGDITGVETLTFGAITPFGKPVSATFVGRDIKELKAAKDELKSVLSSMPKLRDVTDNDQQGIKEVNIRLKQNAYLLGLTLKEVLSQVRAGFFGFEAQRLQRGEDEVKIWVRYDESNRENLSQLEKMWITTNTGDRIPLNEIANYTIERGVVGINHQDGMREYKVEAELANPKDAAAEIQAEVNDEVIPKILKKYPTVRTAISGQQKEMAKTIRSAQLVIPVVLFLIWIVIAFTFRSLGQPLLIMAGIPLSLVGVAWGHYFHDIPINILSFLGIIALVGIIVNDSLVLVSKMNSNLKEGMSFDRAIYKAGIARFRAIFLTTLTTVAGLVPLIFFEKSFQAQFLIPMAVSIAYGITISTVVTLLVLPMMLKVSNKLKVIISSYWNGRRYTREEVERAMKDLKASTNEELN